MLELLLTVLIVLAALVYCLWPLLPQAWRQHLPGRRQPAGGCGSCSQCGACPSGREPAERGALPR